MGSHPLLALNGREIPLTASPQLTKEIWRKLVFSFMTSEQIETLAQHKTLDLALDLKDLGPFRALISVETEAFNLSIYTAAKAPPPSNGSSALPAVETAAPAAAPAPGPSAPPAAPPPPPSPSAPAQPGSTAGASKMAELAAKIAARTAAAAAEKAAAQIATAAEADAAAAASPPEGLAAASPAPAPGAMPNVSEAPTALVAPAFPPAPAGPAAIPAPQPAEVRPAPVQETSGSITVTGVRVGPPVRAAHPYRPEDVTIDELLSILLDKGGSDLHLHERKRPLIRADGHLAIAHERVVDAYNVMAMVENVSTPEERALLFARNDLDTSYNLKALSRFRVNIFRDTRGFGMVLRTIPFKIPNYKDLGVPEAAHKMAFRPHGLFLVTGPTGSGKSTTLASLVHDVNQTQYKHIVTIEDPIEFVHNDLKCCITQREVGVDTPSFAQGVVDVLRQDPDLILVGEMRDVETMANALLAAESGRLVMATLHTTSCAQTIERIINVFPEEAQGVARTQLANSLVGILSQTLLPRKNGGRIAGFEVMLATESIRNLLKENKPQMLQTAIETGAKFGMKSLDQHLLELVEGGLVNFEDAYAKCQNTKNFKALEAKLKGVPVSTLPEE